MKKFMKKLAKKAEGFTLVELIVVIAILGILAGIAVPAYSGYLKKANKAADETTLAAVKTAAMANAAKEGTVTKIIATESTVTVWLNDADEAASPGAGDNITADADFELYIGMDPYSIDLKTGSTATWTDDTGVWAITG